MFHMHPHAGVLTILTLFISEIHKKNKGSITILTKFKELINTTYSMTIYQLSKKMLQLHLKFINVFSLLMFSQPHILNQVFNHASMTS